MGQNLYFYSIFLTLIFYGFSIDSVLASQKDSLLLLVQQTNDDNRKVDLFNQISALYTDTALTEAIKYADLAYELAVKKQYHFGEAQSLYHKGRSLATNNQFKESLPIVEKAIAIIKGFPDRKKEHAQFLLLQGWANNRLSQFYRAIVLYNEAFEIFDSLQNDKGKAIALSNIGTIHNGVGDLETALTYYQKAKSVNEQLDNKIGLVYCNNNIGYIHYLKKEYRSALVYYQQGLRLAEETRILRMNSTILANMGISYMELAEFDKAIASFKQGQEIDLSLKDELSLAYSRLFIAKISFLQSKKETTLSTLQETYQIGVKFNDIELQRLSAESLSEMYANLGFFEKALNQNLLATQLQDSIANKDIQLQIKSLEVKKQFSNKQRELALEKKEALLEASLSYQTNIRNMLLAFMGLLILGGLMLFRAYRTTFAVKEQLLVKNSSLEKTEERLAQKNTDLQRYIDLNVELEQFAYIASHDIKAPLKTMANFTNILKHKFYEQSGAEEKTCFDFVEKSAKSLNLLVEDLLEFSRSNSKTLNIERLAFGRLVAEVVQNLDFSITQSNGKIITTNCDFFIHADQIKLKQILQNLLSNALKFRANNRAPIINVIVWEDKHHFFIAVKDNGIGIPEEHFTEVFEKFARLNRKDKFEGSGLGLAICANYINMHQGEIWIERNELYGTTFTFTIQKDLPLSNPITTIKTVKESKPQFS